jgi:hypothetical protein
MSMRLAQIRGRAPQSVDHETLRGLPARTMIPRTSSVKSLVLAPARAGGLGTRGSDSQIHSPFLIALPEISPPPGPAAFSSAHQRASLGSHPRRRTPETACRHRRSPVGCGPSPGDQAHCRQSSALVRQFATCEAVAPVRRKKLLALPVSVWENCDLAIAKKGRTKRGVSVITPHILPRR